MEKFVQIVVAEEESLLYPTDNLQNAMEIQLIRAVQNGDTVAPVQTIVVALLASITDLRIKELLLILLEMDVFETTGGVALSSH